MTTGNTRTRRDITSRATRRGLAPAIFVVALVVMLTLSGGAGRAAVTLPACTAAQLALGAQQVGAVTVNQGVGSYAYTPQYLVRGKETLVRFYLTNPAVVGMSCTGSISVTGATMTVANVGGTSLSPISSNQSYGTGIAISSTAVTANSAADPTFVLPGPRANSCLVDLSNGGTCGDTTAFALTFTASVTYKTSASTTGALSNTVGATFDKATNSLRLLVVPMGDKSQTYSSQFSSSAQQAIQNGFAAVSRLLPVPYGVSSSLANPDACGTPHRCGIIYTLDLSAMLDLKLVPGSYDSNGKFCGTQANFDGIKGQLDTFLQAYNNNPANSSHPADRVLGAVDAAISDGFTVGCAEAMAAVPVSSQNAQPTEAWVRAIPDKAATNKTNAIPSHTGALIAMEIGHTLGLRKQTAGNLTWHSPLTASDATAPDRAFNVSSRSFISDDRTVMRFTKTSTDLTPWNNNDTAYEPLDFDGLLCDLGGSISADCTNTVTVNGTSTNQITGTPALAGQVVVISGDTDFTPAGTHVVESYSYGDSVTHVLQGLPDPNSNLRLILKAGGLQVADIGVPYSTTTSEHDELLHLNTSTAVFGGAFASAAFDRLELWSGTTLLYSADAETTAPQVTVDNSTRGGSTTISETLTTPQILPKPDIYFLADTTGSMGTALANVKTHAQSILTTVRAQTNDPRFGAGDYKDFPSDTYAFNNAAPIPASEDSGTAALDAIGLNGPPVTGWIASGGGDRPEAQLFALKQLASADTAGFDPHWRSGSSRIIVWFGDNPGHDPICPAISGLSTASGNITKDTVAAALKAAGVRVIAVSVNTGVGSLGLDNTSGVQDGAGQYFTACDGAANNNAGQATAIVNTTGGSLQSGVSETAVSDAILAGLHALPATVTHTATCDPGLAVGFESESKTVTSGSNVTFDETVSVSTSATPGATLTCTVHFLVNGQQPTDPAFTQTITKTVSSLQVATVTATSNTPSKLRAHLLYDCGNGEQLPAGHAMGFPPDSIAGNTAQWQVSFDATLQCAGRSGPGMLTAFVTNGVQGAYSPTPAGVATPTKSPTAAIYQPTQDMFLPTYKAMPLNGSVVDPEDGDLTRTWSIVRQGGGLTISPTGSPADVAPPDGRWPLGDYIVTLKGTDSGGNPATATTVVHVVTYQFSGFLQPVDNPPVLNLGTAGRTYPVKWTLTDGQTGAVVADTAVVEAIRFTTFQAGTGCTSALTDTLVTTATGATSLRVNLTTGEYMYNWQTPSTAGCYVLSVAFNDGNVYTALFKLR